MLTCLFVGSFSQVYAYAEDNQMSIDSERVIVVDTEIINQKLLVSRTDDAMTSCFVVKSGATLKLTNCEIWGTDGSSTYTYLSTLFEVENGGKLILETVTFNEIKYDSGINNSGDVEISDVTFMSENTSITNITPESNENRDPIIYLGSGSLGKVRLNAGYISIDEKSYVSGTTTISLPSSKKVAGKLIVKGTADNVFASRNLNNFVLTGASDTQFLDYIGDHDGSTTITDAKSDVVLQSGDIIISEMAEDFMETYLDEDENKIDFSATNCTANKYLQTQNYLFRKNVNGEYVKLNNYTAITDISSGQYTRVSSAKNKYVTATINRFKDDGTELPGSYETIFNAGSNHAVFVDIPQDYELESVEFYIGSEKNDSILKISSEKYSNGYYMRPILEYIYNDGTNEIYDNIDISVNFIFSEVEKVAVVNVTSDNVVVNHEENLIVGNMYTFTIPLDSSIEITSILFNGEEIDFEIDESNYYFSALIEKEVNTIYVDYLNVITIDPNPEVSTFEYEEPIILQEEYPVGENEKIIITYTPNESLTPNTYNITSATCDNPKYKIVVNSGKTYTITPKALDLSEIVETKTAYVTYSNNLQLETSMFIESMPDYLGAELIQTDFDPIVGNNTMIIEFTLKSSNYCFKDNINTLNVTLNITAGTLDTSSCSLVNNYSTEYTGEIIELHVTNYDPNIIDVSYEYYLINGQEKTLVPFAKDSGEYEVVARLSSLHSLYTTDKVLTARFTITKVDIVLTSYISDVARYEFTYDGKSHSAKTDIKSLPSMVSVDTGDTNTGFINVGTYTVTINFIFDEKNYNCIDSCTSTVVIKPKSVKIALVNSTFDFNGNTPTLSAVVTEGLVGSDACTVTLSNNVAINAGNHSIAVESISNDNYCFTTGLELSYTINKINVDLGGVTFENINVVYDGNKHLPTLNGVLPAGITYTIDNKVNCKDVGDYQVKCTFDCSNSNYYKPDPIYARVTITKRPVMAIFTEPSNMIANGIAKEIIVSFNNIVEGENINYTSNYSAEPINAGQYTLTINIPSTSNYSLSGSSEYTFKIFTNTLSVRAEGVNVKFYGKFTDINNVDVTKVNNTNIETMLEDKNVKSYTSLNFAYTNYSTDSIQVSVKAGDIVSSTKYLRLYRVSGDSLEEVEYSLKGGLIIFNLSSNSEIVFVEGNTIAYTYRFAIYTIYGLTVLAGIGYIIFIVRYAKSRNPYLKLNSKNR
jgi:hypothetical protein